MVFATTRPSCWPTSSRPVTSAATSPGVKPGHIVAVGGCGPVGLMAQMAALLRGAAKVYAFDRVPERLAMAKKIGATPVNVDKEDPVQRVLD